VDDLIEIIYTSGTTGDPKGVCITHRNLLANITPLEQYVEKYIKWERFVHPIRLLELLPLSHVFGQIMGFFVPELIRGEVFFQESLNPSEIIETTRHERISVIVTVPRLLDSLRDKIERQWEAQHETEKFQKALAQADDRHFLKTLANLSPGASSVWPEVLGLRVENTRERWTSSMPVLLLAFTRSSKQNRAIKLIDVRRGLREDYSRIRRSL